MTKPKFEWGWFRLTFFLLTIGFVVGNIRPWHPRMSRHDQYYYDEQMDSAFYAIMDAYSERDYQTHEYLDSLYVAGARHYNKAHKIKNNFLMKNK